MTATSARTVPVEVEEDKSAPRKSPSAFRTISEVADELGVQQHVLRFWETKFTQIKPLKRGGGRRYYRPEDVLLLQRIYDLLYNQGYTIKGVQKLLKGQGKQQIAQQQASSSTVSNDASEQAVTVQASANASQQQAQGKGLSAQQRDLLKEMLGELREMRAMIKLEKVS